MVKHVSTSSPTTTTPWPLSNTARARTERARHRVAFLIGLDQVGIVVDRQPLNREDGAELEDGDQRAAGDGEGGRELGMEVRDAVHVRPRGVGSGVDRDLDGRVAFARKGAPPQVHGDDVPGADGVPAGSAGVDQHMIHSGRPDAHVSVHVHEPFRRQQPHGAG